jgi:uncharacterized protein (TIGR02145 family)
MKRTSSILILALFAVIVLTGCGKSSNEVKIGDQVWMTENLNVDVFRNGDTIFHAKTAEEWEEAGKNKQPAWCYYENDPANGEKYGKLYNWYAVNDARGLAPEGWKIPSDYDFTKLAEYLGGEYSAGTKMKSTAGWNDNGNGTNQSGFSGLPGGERCDWGFFEEIGLLGFWWSYAEAGDNSAYSFSLSGDEGDLYQDLEEKAYGFSVRCLRE